MADPFSEPLPAVGQKPWNLNPAIGEIRDRLSDAEDAISSGSGGGGGGGGLPADTTLDDIPDGTVAKQFTATEKTKLAGIATGATANATNASLRDRSTHTGTQAVSTVTGLQSALDGKAASTHAHAQSDVTGLSAALSGKADTSHSHAISGVTGLQTALDAKAADANTQKLSRWNTTTRTYETRSATAPWGWEFSSANDPTATAPNDPNLKPGDIWRRHPNAE